MSLSFGQWVSCSSPPLPPCASKSSPSIAATVFSLPSIEGPNVLDGEAPLPWYARQLRLAIAHFPSSYPASSALIHQLGQAQYSELVQQLNTAAHWSPSTVRRVSAGLWSAYISAPLAVVFAAVYGLVTWSDTHYQYDNNHYGIGLAAVAIFAPFFVLWFVLVRYYQALATHRVAAVLSAFNSGQQTVQCTLQIMEPVETPARGRSLKWTLHFTH